MSAFFWLPALLEKKYDAVSYWQTIAGAGQHFVTLPALLFSKWQYGFSTPQDPLRSMSYQIGWVIVVASCLVGWRLIKSRTKHDSLSLHGVFFLLVFISSVFLVLPFAQPIYTWTKLGTLLNFPWRFLTLTTLAGGVLVALVTVKKRWSALLAIIASLVLGWSMGSILTPVFSEPDVWYQTTTITHTGSIQDTEYLPIWANYFAVLEHKGRATDFFQSQSPLTTTSYLHQNLEWSAQIVTPLTTKVQVQQFYFPGWRASIDGLPQVVSHDEFGLVTFEVPPGQHNLKVIFADTGVRTLANMLSLGGLCLFFVSRYFLQIKNFFHHRKQQNHQ